MALEIRTTISKLTKEVNMAKDSNDELQNALKKSQVDVLCAGYEAFERAKT